MVTATEILYAFRVLYLVFYHVSLTLRSSIDIVEITSAFTLNNY